LLLDKHVSACNILAFSPLARSGMTSRSDWRHDNTGRLLFDSTRRFQERVLELVNRKGFPELRIAHLAVTRHIDLAGTRIADVALRAGVTKQSMGEMIDQLERMGFLSRFVDAEDKRAKIVKFTPRGRKLLTAIRAAVASTEKELTDCIGAVAVQALRISLTSYCRIEDGAGESGPARHARQRSA
jgi:DNA-binding MarR family transcriptional regulator